VPIFIYILYTLMSFKVLVKETFGKNFGALGDYKYKRRDTWSQRTGVRRWEKKFPDPVFQRDVYFSFSWTLKRT
jgi:hypothetical protein